MGCGTSFVKYVLFFFNMLVALFGLAIIGVGVGFLLNWRPVMDELQSHVTVAPWVFIIVGCITFVIAFFGCCGAIRESHCMVVTYAIFLLVIIIVQVILAVLLFVYGDTLKEGIAKSVNKLFQKQSSDGVDKATEAIINNLQTQFKCCGGEYPTLGFKLDSSCCETGAPICTTANAYSGCTPTIVGFYDKWRKPIGGIAIGVACFEIVGALFSLYLANSIRNMDRRYA